MNKLTINHGSFNLDEIDLDHGTVTIGRATDNDIRLDDSAVSSHHAKIVTFFNVSYIEDLDSTNGTIVNGRVIKKYTLHTGDIVLLGKHQLLFQGSQAPEANVNSDSTVVMSQSDVKKAMASKPEQAAPIGGIAPAVSPPPAAPIPATAAIAEPDVGVNVTREPSPAPMTAAPHVAEAERRPVAPQTPPLGRIEPATPPSIPAPPPAVKAAPVKHTPTPAAVTPKRPIVENMPQKPATADELFNPAPLNSLEQHNEAFSLLNDNEDDLKIGNTPFTAFESDESLLIPAFIKSDKTSLNKPTARKPAAQAAPSATPPPMRSNPPPVTRTAAEPAAVAPKAVPKAPKRKQVKKVLEDPSVSFGDPVQHSAPMGINEIDRVNQYREKSDATNPGIGMPAVGDRTLLKQIITGDSSFTTSKNKFEIVQIVLGFVIFAIIALITFASF